MNVSSEELINLYNNRKRKTMLPSPYVLFFLKHAKVIAKDNIKTITPEELLKEITDKWINLSLENKQIYFETSQELGYEVGSFKVRNEKFLKIKNKIKQTKNKLNFDFKN